ncbi:MAG: pyrimidine 5'-nucleotidase [Hyphomonadaceae bacterium]|nr:pyrimidine 5'-nucleotidase [Hyphomonadaceae bacterium]MBC6413091.1 pyrimidine 5'-nucleotidase [Hyphomonadaceae bacterium]
MLRGITDWIFDLDNTLYRGDARFFAQIDKKMTDYIARYLALHPTEARLLQKEYLVEYGTSLSGLMAVHGMDPADFLDYVHDIDLDMLKPKPELRSLIDALPGRKFILTNGSRGHARKVGTHLGLYDLFDGVFAIEDVDYIPKPKRSPYVCFCDAFDIEATQAIMFEDSIRNLEVPKYMGMRTVLVTSDHDWHTPVLNKPTGETGPAPYVDYVTDDLVTWLSAHT